MTRSRHPGSDLRAKNMFYSTLLLFAGLASRASAACTRATLQATVDAYLEAQAAGQLSKLPLAANVSYLENDVTMDVAAGVLSKAMTIDTNITILDTTECAAFAEIVAATNPHPYVIHTRMLLDEASKIKTLQSVVADTGDWIFNATATLQWTLKELATWKTVPKARIMPADGGRSVLRAAADAYLNSWTDPNWQGKVPYGTPCARLEGGLYTGSRNESANTCVMPLFPVQFNITNRRYVIDEELVAISVFNDFPFLDTTRPEGTPSANLFKLDGALIRYIHEVTVCATTNCGR